MNQISADSPLTAAAPAATVAGWRRRRQRRLTLLMAPFLVGTLLLVLLPALVTLAISFTEYNAVRAPRWVGTANYQRLFSGQLPLLSMQNTLIFIGLAVPIRLLAAFLLALLLQRRGRLFGVMRAAVYVPTIIPEAAYALIWLWVLNPVYGPLNVLLATLGLPTPAWLIQEGSARMAIVLMVSFQIGEGFIILLAGLQNIPRMLYDAARVDGAGGLQLFQRITVPLIAPWLLLLVFRDLIVALQASFTPSFILTYGGPYYATTFVPLLIYELAFDFFDFGTAAALLVVTFILTGVLTLGVVNLLALQER